MLRHFPLSLFLAMLMFVGNGSAGTQDPPTPIPLDAQINSQLAELAGRVLDHAKGAACDKKNCSILVTNFVDPSGNTSALGIQLADAFSAQLALQAKSIQIVERCKLRIFLEQERIPSKLLDDRAMPWLASRLSASAVLIGYLKKEKTAVSLRVQLQNAEHGAKKKAEKALLLLQDADRFLAPTEPFGDVPHSQTTSRGEKIFTAGRDGTTMPHCYLHPDPQYSVEDANFQGPIMLEIAVSPDESVEDVRMVRGVPLGLNDKARKAVAGWRCKPGLLNGTPVLTRVPVELTFSLLR